MLLRLEFWVLKEAGEDAEELFLQILDARIGTYLQSCIEEWTTNKTDPF